MTAPPPGLLILLMLSALVLSAFFSSSETAAFQIGPSDLADLERLRPRVARALRRVLANRRGILVTVLLGNLVTNLFYFNVGQVLAQSVGVPWHGMDGRLLIDFLVLLGVLLFGDVFPKTLAVLRPLAVASVTAQPLLWCERVLRLPRIALTFVSDAVVRLIGLESEEGDLTAGELQQVLAVSAARGELAMDEHEWLRALVELDEVPVREVMVPRVDMIAFDLAQGREAFIRRFVESRRNKIPVFEETIDRVLGYVNAKDVITEPDVPLARAMLPVLFVPESASVADVMEQMRRADHRLAIVVDEYGGTEGMVTREDLVESVIGDLRDEHEARWEPVREIGPGSFLVDAALPLHESRRVFGVDPRRLGAATLGGLVTAILERVPRVGDEVDLGVVHVKVASMRGRLPDRLIVRHRSAPATPEDAA